MSLDTEFNALKSKFDKAKSELQTANSAVKEVATERRNVLDQLNQVLDGAKHERTARDKANSATKEAKANRDALTRQLNEARKTADASKEGASALKGGLIGSPYGLQKRLDGLRDQLHRTKLTPRKEDALVDEIEALESQLEKHAAVLKASSLVKKSNLSLGDLKAEAQTFHKLVVLRAEEGEVHHSKMREAFKKADALKKQLKQLTTSLNEKKKLANEKYAEFTKANSEMGGVQKQVSADKKVKAEKRESEKKASVRDRAKVVYERFKSGETIDGSDMILLQDFLANQPDPSS
ncbi:MAG: hypothetical protein GOV15_00965 [Candidatus Diapherotrites archaeon]|nr:hypothetical protein [Candidatus Diapherotrites archaeon]